MKPIFILGGAAAFAGILFLLLVPHWVLPPIKSVDYGPPAGEMVVFHKEGANAIKNPQPEVPESVVPASDTGPLPYKNVQVLKGLSKHEFDRTMVAITQWVAPKKGCGFCHGGQTKNYAADYPRKEIARQMLRMVRTVNADWTNHVGAQGITCFSCHRGHNMPANSWYLDTPQTSPEGGMLGKVQAWNTQAKSIRKFFPRKPFRMFLLEGLPAHSVQADKALASTGPKAPEHDRDYAEDVYILMMQMSNSLGVNCTYCHQSRAMADWSQSPPNRLNGYSGIKMTVALNQTYFSQLAKYLPKESLGKMGDAPKINCKSCHTGREKPVGGMLRMTYPGLIGPMPTGPANPVVRANPDIPLLSRHPIVGKPYTLKVNDFVGTPQG